MAGVEEQGKAREWSVRNEELLHYGPCRKFKLGIRLVFGEDVAMWPYSSYSKIISLARLSN